MQNLTEIKDMIKNFSLKELIIQKQELERQLVLMIDNPDLVEKLSLIEAQITQHQETGEK